MSLFWWIVSVLLLWPIMGCCVYAYMDMYLNGRLLKWFEQDPIKPIGQMIMYYAWPVFLCIFLYDRRTKR